MGLLRNLGQNLHPKNWPGLIWQGTTTLADKLANTETGMRLGTVKDRIFNHVDGLTAQVTGRFGETSGTLGARINEMRAAARDKVSTAYTGLRSGITGKIDDIKTNWRDLRDNYQDNRAERHQAAKDKQNALRNTRDEKRMQQQFASLTGKLKTLSQNQPGFEFQPVLTPGGPIIVGADIRPSLLRDKHGSITIVTNITPQDGVTEPATIQITRDGLVAHGFNEKGASSPGSITAIMGIVSAAAARQSKQNRSAGRAEPTF